jgi:hypothetical protein
MGSEWVGAARLGVPWHSRSEAVVWDSLRTELLHWRLLDQFGVEDVITLRCRGVGLADLSGSGCTRGQLVGLKCLDGLWTVAQDVLDDLVGDAVRPG